MSENRWKSIIDSARHDVFVGRRDELNTGRQFLEDKDRRVLYVHGVGGIGKTTLLHQLAEIAEEDGWTTRWVDATLLGDSAPEIEEAFLQAVDLEGKGDVLLLLDNFEAIAHLDKWMRDSLFAELPSNMWMAVAGRPKLSQSWRLDPAWSQLTTTISLGPFDECESATFLHARGVDEVRHDEIVEMAHGMPIALALAAENALHETHSSELLSATDVNDLVRRLTERHASPAQRRALRVAALTWAVSEDLLDAVIEDTNATELMQWLADQPYMQATNEGIQPHPVVRELIDEQFRTTAPTERQDLRDALKSVYFKRLRSRGFARQGVVGFQLLFMSRRGRGIAPKRLSESEEIYFDRPSDDDEISARIEEFEGPRAAEICRHYLERFPELSYTVRDASGHPRGFLQVVALDRCTRQDRDLDPVLDAALTQLDDLDDLREGETARMARFWFDVDHYQDESPLQGRIMVKIMQEVSSVPGATYGLSVHRDPEKWEARKDKFLETLTTVELDGHDFAIFSRDWRRFDRVEFMDHHLTFAMTGEGPPHPLEARFDVLERDEFAPAVRDALKNFHRGDRLVESALARCRISAAADYSERCPSGVELRIRSVIEDAIASLGDSGGDQLHRDILAQTFLEPTAKQRAVAEQMSMSFSTYRRKLNEAIDRVVSRLWHRELHGPP